MAFFYIKSDADLKHLAALRDAAVIGVDMETTGKNPLLPQQSRVRLIQLATGRDTFVVDVKHTQPMAVLEPVLRDPDIVKVFHHAKFDVKHLLYHYAIEVKNLFCTMLASQLLAMGRRGFRHSLAEVSRRFLGKSLDKELQFSDWSGALSESQIHYAAMDAEILVALHRELDGRLKREKLGRVSQLEFRTVIPVAALELKGIHVDREQLAEVEARLRRSCETLEEEIGRELHPVDALPGMNVLNLNAPEQVKQALHDRGIHVQDTADHRLRPLAERYPFLGKLLEYRHKQKIVGSTLRPFAEAVLPETGRVHPSYHQIASASGRFACSDPNIQQVPREPEIRACFTPERGYKYLVADYSQVELRVAAGLAKDRLMLQAYGKGEDLHRLTAALTMGKAPDRVTKEERQAAKAINFGLIYAMGSRGLQSSARQSYGVNMTVEDADTFRSRYFENYKGIQQWQRDLEREGRRRGYVRTAAGRIRSYKGEEIRVTELFNIPVQGTAAEGLKSAMCIFWDRVRDEALDAAIVAIIHDEIIVEVREDQVGKVREVLEQSMIDGVSWLVPGVPFEVECAVGDSWAIK